MFRFLFFALLFTSAACSAQKKVYTTANAHSHNDYEKPVPFHAAWQQGFGSIEADIFLHKGQLIVAHDSSQLSRGRTLDSLYLRPLQLYIEKNGGRVYANNKRSLQLMIDIKSEAISTLHKLIETLETYPALIRTKSLTIAISGARPAATAFASYPEWIRFDGELRKEYQPAELEKIDMMSDNFARYSAWKGIGLLPEIDRQLLKQWIDKSHSLGKKIRFWNAPDTDTSWTIFKELGVDYINTDHIEEISKFLR